MFGFGKKVKFGIWTSDSEDCKLWVFATSEKKALAEFRSLIGDCEIIRVSEQKLNERLNNCRQLIKNRAVQSVSEESRFPFTIVPTKREK